MEDTPKGRHLGGKIEGGLRLKAGHKFINDASLPLITIITAVRNGDKTLECTIKSVLDQSYDRIEYIIIDGGSTDGTLDIIRKYDNRINFWISEPDNGIYDAMNKGIALATGDLIALLNSDDYYEQGALASVADIYRNYRAKGRFIIYGDYYILDDRIQVRTEFRSNLKFWTGMSICHQALFVSRDVYRTSSLYDTSLHFAADYAFLVDAIRSGVQFIPSGKFLVTFRNAGASYTHVAASYQEILLVLRQRFGILSRYVWMFIITRLLKSVVATAAKRILEKTVSTNCQVRLKLLYNKVSRRVSYKV
jgi:glycosyltransferase involved in cell wall biosynthesis